MFYYDWTFIILIPAFILAMVAQTKVKSAYSRYARVPNQRGMTGERAARMILDSHGLHDVPVERVAGELSDQFRRILW